MTNYLWIILITPAYLELQYLGLCIAVPVKWQWVGVPYYTVSLTSYIVYLIMKI